MRQRLGVIPDAGRSVREVGAVAVLAVHEGRRLGEPGTSIVRELADEAERLLRRWC